MFVRFSQNKNNPARTVFKKIRLEDKTINRLGKKPSFTNSTITNVNMCKLEKSMISSVPKPIPLWNLEEIDIDISLTKYIDKKTSNIEYMKETSETLLVKKYSAHHKVYTDASKEGESVGIGIFFERDKKRHCFKTNDHLAITTAELVAIQKVMEMVLSPTFEDQTHICICTDSLGACLALKGDPNQTARPDIAHNIIILHHQILSKGIVISLLWIPSHVDIIGNEIADACANEGRRRVQVDINIKLGYSELKSLISNMINSDMAQTQYEEINHYKVDQFRQIVQRINTKINLDGDNYLLNRLRVGAAMFDLPGRELYCRICKCRLTIDHVMMKCTVFENERERVVLKLSNEQIRFSPQSFLAIDNSKDVRKEIFTMLKAINKKFEI